MCAIALPVPVAPVIGFIVLRLRFKFNFIKVICEP